MNTHTKAARWWNDRTLFLYHMGRSNYITAIWNWFMILAGKAAEPFLFASVLYSGYELLPGVPQPGAMLDAGVFVAQQATLDIGGMGLMKIAQEEGHGKESFSYRVGFILISLMIANVVLAMMKRLIPNFGGAAAVIEGCLLIARAIMCVVYGYAIHSIRKETRESGSVVKSSDVQDRLEQFSEQMQQSQALLLQHVQSVQNSIPALVQSQSHVIIAEMQEVVQSQIELRIQPQVQGVHSLVHSLSTQLPVMVQEQVQYLVSEQMQPLIQVLENDANTTALQELTERLREVSTSVSEMRTTITEVRTVTQRKPVSEQGEPPAKRVSKEPVRLVHSTAKVIESEQDSEPLDQRIKGYILGQREQGHEPSLAEIMDKCDCSKGSAIRYRRELDDDDEAVNE